MMMLIRAHSAALTAGLLLVLAAGSVAAQNTPVPPPARDPKACSDEQRLQAPNGAARQPLDPSNQTLSDKLERSEGVVCPPAGDCPEVGKPPPRRRRSRLTSAHRQPRRD